LGALRDGLLRLLSRQSFVVEIFLYLELLIRQEVAKWTDWAVDESADTSGFASGLS
jgi:hypothetical protein